MRNRRGCFLFVDRTKWWSFNSLTLCVFSWWDVCIFKKVTVNAWLCVYFRMVTLNCLMLCVFSGRTHWPAWHCVYFLNCHTQSLRPCIFRMVTLNCLTLCIFSMVTLISLLLCVFSGWSHWISWRCVYFQDGHTDLLNTVCIFWMVSLNAWDCTFRMVTLNILTLCVFSVWSY